MFFCQFPAQEAAGWLQEAPPPLELQGGLPVSPRRGGDGHTAHHLLPRLVCDAACPGEAGQPSVPCSPAERLADPSLLPAISPPWPGAWVRLGPPTGPALTAHRSPEVSAGSLLCAGHSAAVGALGRRLLL